MAEAFEKARYEQLRGQRWSELRAGERTTRIELAVRALDDAGITTHVATLREGFDRADGLDGILAQRDAEITRRHAEHEAEEQRLADLRAADVARLEDEITRLREQLEAALERAGGSEQRARTAEAVVDAVRTALDTAGPPADGTGTVEVPTPRTEMATETAIGSRTGVAAQERTAVSPEAPNQAGQPKELGADNPVHASAALMGRPATGRA